jgi:hypothetical protein
MPLLLMLYGLGCLHSDPRGVTLPEDVVKREANRTKNERQYARKQEEWRKGAAWAAAKMQGEESSSKSESSGDNEEDEEGEIISNHSPPLESLPPPGLEMT